MELPEMRPFIPPEEVRRIVPIEASVSYEGQQKSTNPLLLPQAMLNDSIREFRDGIVKAKKKDIERTYEDLDGKSCLEYACMNGLTEFVTCLLETGARVRGTRRKGTKGVTPLHLAIMGGHFDLVELLLEYKANVAQQDGWWRTPLHMAAALFGYPKSKGIPTPNYYSILSLLLVQKDCPINQRDYDRVTPLHLAVLREWKEGVLLLLRYGADVRSSTSETSTMELIEQNMPEIFESVSIESDEDSGERGDFPNADDQEEDDKTPQMAYDGFHMSKVFPSSPFFRLTSKTDSIIIPPTPPIPQHAITFPKTPDEEVPTPPPLPPAVPRPVSPDKKHANKLSNLQKRMFRALCFEHNEELEGLVADAVAQQEDLNANNGRYTYLQYACTLGNEVAAQILVDHDCDPNMICNSCKIPPLHLAAKEGFHKVTKVLWEQDEIDIKYLDEEQQSVLHIIAKREKDGMYTTGEHLRRRDYTQCMQDLLEILHSRQYQLLDINQRDKIGNTALHYASQGGSSQMIMALISNGACLGITNNNEEVPVTKVPPHVLESCLNNCIIPQGDSENEDVKLRFTFHLLAPSSRQDLDTDLFQQPDNDTGWVPETKVLYYVSQSGHLTHLLKHPVIDLFLQVKWRCIRRFFFLNVFLYAIFLAIMTAYLILSLATDDSQKAGYVPLWITIGLITMTFWLVIREGFQMTASGFRYFSDIENVMELSIIILTLVILFVPMDSAMAQQVSPFLLLLAWTELVFVIGRHPRLTTHVQMFMTVTRSYLKALGTFSMILLAFALAFYTQFHTYETVRNSTKTNETSTANLSTDASIEEQTGPSFHTAHHSFLQTLLFMLGAGDPGDISLEGPAGGAAAYALLLLFLFFVMLVLVNLLNGLAVSDTNAVREKAKLLSLCKRVEFAYFVETLFLTDPCQLWLPLRLFSCVCKGESFEWLYHIRRRLVFCRWVYSSLLFPQLPEHGVTVELQDFGAVIKDLGDFPLAISIWREALKCVENQRSEQEDSEMNELVTNVAKTQNDLTETLKVMKTEVRSISEQRVIVTGDTEKRFNDMSQRLDKIEQTLDVILQKL